MAKHSAARRAGPEPYLCGRPAHAQCYALEVRSGLTFTMPTAQQLQRGGSGALLAVLLASVAVACRAQPIAISIPAGSATPRLDAMKQHALAILDTMEGELLSSCTARIVA